MQDDLDDSACVRLVCAVAVRALKDSRKGDASARQWWTGEAVPWLEMVGINVDETDLAGALTDDR